MRYCLRCKLRAAEQADRCAKCGGELRTLGAPAPQTAPASLSPQPVASSPHAPASVPVRLAPASPISIPSQPYPTPTAGTVDPQAPVELQLQLSGLQQAVAQSGRRVQRLIWTAIGLVLLLAVSLVFWRWRHVQSYAEVDSVVFEVIPDKLAGVTIEFRPQSAGKVELFRRDGSQTERLIEHIPAGGPYREQKFTWEGNDSDYTITIRSRGFLSLRERTFSPRQAGGALKQ